jgi:hypothetical protein
MFDYSDPDPMSENIQLAANRLCYNTEEEVMASFVETGMDEGQAFLIVKAGKILLNDKYQADLEDGVLYEDILAEEVRKINGN